MRMRDSAMRSSVTDCSAMALTEGHAHLDTPTHPLERALGDTDEAHGVMYAPGTQAALRNLEAAPFAEQHIGGRHAHVLEVDLHVPVRRIVEAEHRSGAAGSLMPAASRGTRIIDCCRCRGARRIGLAHEDEQAAARGCRRPRSTTCGR